MNFARDVLDLVGSLWQLIAIRYVRSTGSMPAVGRNIIHKLLPYYVYMVAACCWDWWPYISFLDLQMPASGDLGNLPFVLAEHHK